jgi:hypothetical protein
VVLLYLDVRMYSMLQCRPQVGTVRFVHHPGFNSDVYVGVYLHPILRSPQTVVYSLLTSCACSIQSLLTDALTQGKTLGLQNKQRGAVVLRKALDKLAADFEKVCCLLLALYEHGCYLTRRSRHC